VFLRALIAFIALPGVVALAIPAVVGFRQYGTDGQFFAIGLLPLGVGLALLLWCVRDFYTSGKGTLAPWSPPRRLVTSGLYRFSRNPMYVAVAMMLAGWAVLFWSAVLGAYGLGVLIGFQLRIVFGEEPYLARTHGEQWREYAARVPRWLWMR
jgi:protein-S-isoprenylcysteine O-methyltransferase Ste14